MTYSRITWAPKVLRAAGLTVVEHDGWKTRGLSETRPFNPRAVVWHHDASAPGDSPNVPASMIDRFEVAGAQIWVDRRGRWHIIASGRAAHAGRVRAGKPDNFTSIGIETDHTTGEDWPPALLDSLRRGTAAIFRHLKTTPEAGLHFHKSICDPPGRKVDPDGLELDRERDRVAALMVPDKRPVVSVGLVKRAAERPTWIRPMGPRAYANRAVVLRALKAEGLVDLRAWQARLGYEHPTGEPDLKSLSALGAKHGFRVVA